MGGERGEFEEGRARVEEGVDPFAGEEFAAGFVAFAGVRGPAAGRVGQAAAELQNFEFRTMGAGLGSATGSTMKGSVIPFRGD